MIKSAVFPLSKAPRGQFLIEKVLWQHKEALRCGELGLFPGQEAEVLGRSGKMLILGVMGAKIALRCTEAHQILVREAAE